MLFCCILHIYQMTNYTNLRKKYEKAIKGGRLFHIGKIKSVAPEEKNVCIKNVVIIYSYFSFHLLFLLSVSETKWQAIY